MSIGSSLRAAGSDSAIMSSVIPGPDSGVLYGNDPDGNNLETGFHPAGMEEQWGWRR